MKSSYETAAGRCVCSTDRMGKTCSLPQMPVCPHHCAPTEHQTKLTCRRKLQWLKDASVTDAGRDQGPARNRTLELASMLTTVRAKGPQVSEPELKAAITNSARSAVALQLRHAAQTKRSTSSSRKLRQPDTERCSTPTPSLLLTETDSIASACGPISFDGCIPAVPQFAPNPDKNGPLSVLALDVANSAGGAGQKHRSSTVASQLRVHAARVKREFRFLEHAAGALSQPFNTIGPCSLVPQSQVALKDQSALYARTCFAIEDRVIMACWKDMAGHGHITLRCFPQQCLYQVFLMYAIVPSLHHSDLAQYYTSAVASS